MMTLGTRMEISMCVGFRRARCSNCKALFHSIENAGGLEDAPDSEFVIASGHLVRVHNLGEILSAEARAAA